MTKYPYNDEKMEFDEVLCQYILTNDALLENGINVRDELDDTPYSATVNRSLRKRVSRRVYNFIHKHNYDNKEQDYLIATVPKMRDIIFEALQSQALYMWINGDLGLLPKKDEAIKSSVCVDCEDTLNTCLPELGGHSILYCGIC